MAAPRASSARALPERTHPLVRRYFEALRVDGISDAAASRRAGLSLCTVRCWRRQHTPRIDVFDAALNDVDLELFIRPRRIVPTEGTTP